MLAEDLLKHYKDLPFKLVVVHGNTIQGHDFEDTHMHEEADTMIPNQVLASVADNPSRDVYVWSPDTDVAILCTHFVKQLGTQLWFKTGVIDKTRF